MQKKRVLFLCTGNSCRSQMAEGLLRHMAGDKFEVVSAGVNPSTVNPLSIEVMKEVGIDISGHRSKSVNEFLGQAFDYVITVCDNARELCPYFHGSRMLHWNIADPAVAVGSGNNIRNAFKKARDDLRRHIVELKS